MELVPSVKRDDVLSRSWKEQKFPLAMCNTMTFKMRLQTIVAAVVPRLYYCYEHVGYDDEAVSVKELVDAFENEDKTLSRRVGQGEELWLAQQPLRLPPEHYRSQTKSIDK